MQIEQFLTFFNIFFANLVVILSQEVPGPQKKVPGLLD